MRSVNKSSRDAGLAGRQRHVLATHSFRSAVWRRQRRHGRRRAPSRLRREERKQHCSRAEPGDKPERRSAASTMLQRLPPTGLCIAFIVIEIVRGLSKKKIASGEMRRKMHSLTYDQ